MSCSFLDGWGEKMNVIQEKASVIVIKTLGGFNVIKDNVSMTQSSAGAKKIWELYKFMLTYRDKSYTPESLLDQLWITEEYADPRSTLRRQMHRLRKTLGEEQIEEQSIIYSNGYYRWNHLITVEIDTDVFTNYVKQGDSLYTNMPEEALKYYLKAIDLYEGDYLPGCIDQHWVFPYRNQLRRSYLQVVSKTIELLRDDNDHDRILDICQKAIHIDIYEERFHVNLMEAMLALGNHRLAFDHYDHISSFYEREMGLKPSEDMRHLYKRLLRSQQTLSSEESLFETLESDTLIENAFFCEPEVFKSIYELERRRSERARSDFSIAVLTIPSISTDRYSQKEARINRLIQHLMKHLRKGDTLTRWATEQVVVLLPGVNDDTIKMIIHRVLRMEDEFLKVTLNQVKHLIATSNPYHN